MTTVNYRQAMDRLDEVTNEVLRQKQDGNMSDTQFKQLVEDFHATMILLFEMYEHDPDRNVPLEFIYAPAGAPEKTRRNAIGIMADAAANSEGMHAFGIMKHLVAPDVALRIATQTVYARAQEIREQLLAQNGLGTNPLSA
ncbi:MAG TPA: hypothetical protein PKV72_05495 [Candidatus Peribacteria bacterium]|nr:hypothetical protein [Candidatus Peribacteria bacterium]